MEHELLFQRGNKLGLRLKLIERQTKSLFCRAFRKSIRLESHDFQCVHDYTMTDSMRKLKGTSKMPGSNLSPMYYSHLQLWKHMKLNTTLVKYNKLFGGLLRILKWGSYYNQIYFIRMKSVAITISGIISKRCKYNRKCVANNENNNNLLLCVPIWRIKLNK